MDRLSNNQSTIRSSSQLPGTGLMETAEGVYDLMQQRDRGADESEIAQVLGRSSGEIVGSLQLYPTRRGLTRLFQKVLPNFAENSLRPNISNDNQRQTFTAPGANISSAVKKAQLYQQGKIIEGAATVSLFDKGLIFSDQSELWLQGKHYRIDSIDERQNRLNVAPKVSASFTRALFRREYDVELGDQFVLERAKHATKNRIEVSRAFIYANVGRKSDQFIVSPADLSLDNQSPTDQLTHNATNCDVTRPYPAVYLIGFRSSEKSINKSLSDQAVRAALAASLQDVVGQLFPLLSHRLAVAAANEEHQASDIYPYLQYRYPAIRTGDPNDFESAIERALKLHGLDVPANGHLQPDKGANLVIIEDADSDLGAIRKLFTSWDDVLKHWATYLAWAKDQPMWTVEGKIFDAKSAYEVVSRMSGM